MSRERERERERERKRARAFENLIDGGLEGALRHLLQGNDARLARDAQRQSVEQRTFRDLRRVGRRVISEEIEEDVAVDVDLRCRKVQCQLERGWPVVP